MPREFDSIARLVNHGIKDANAKPIGPLMVRGRWRIALISITKIKSGDEVLFDYGDKGSNIEWLKKGICTILILIIIIIIIFCRTRNIWT
jgi:hypothetical protein